MTKDYWSSHNEVAASAWQQRNADWWSEMMKANTNIHHHENYSTTSCGPIDLESDHEAAGRLQSTDLHRIIVAALLLTWRIIFMKLKQDLQFSIN